MLQLLGPSQAYKRYLCIMALYQKRVIGVVLANGRQMLASHVLLCTGAWTPAILPELKNTLKPTSQPIIYVRPNEQERQRWIRKPPFGADMSGEYCDNRLMEYLLEDDICAICA